MMGRLHPAVPVLCLAVSLAALALLLPPFRLFVVGQLAIVIIVTAAVTLLMGTAGLLSLSSAASMAIGGYGVLLLAGQAGIPFALAAMLAVGIGVGIGLLLGLVALRLSGFHLAIITLGLLQVVLVLLRRGGSITGGGYGFVVPPIAIGPWGALSTNGVAGLSVFVAVLVVAACTALVRSRIGRAWLALRDNEAAARMQGIDVSRMKITAFAFASGLISLAGVLHVLLLGVANPNSYLVDLSIFHITLVVVGGTTGSMTGAVVAPIILYLLPELFHALGEWRDVFYGSVLLLTLILLPRGIGSAVASGARRLWPARRVVS